MLIVVRRNQYGEVVPATYKAAQVKTVEKSVNKKSAIKPVPKGVKRGKNRTQKEKLTLCGLTTLAQADRPLNSEEMWAEVRELTMKLFVWDVQTCPTRLEYSFARSFNFLKKAMVSD